MTAVTRDIGACGIAAGPQAFASSRRAGIIGALSGGIGPTTMDSSQLLEEGPASGGDIRIFVLHCHPSCPLKL